MLITGKADEVVLQGIKNTLYPGAVGENMCLHVLGKNWVVWALNYTYFTPLF